MNVFERYLTVWVFICILVGIAAGQLFELAVAAAISLFGFESGAALTTVVGVLIEVPVMLLVVGVVNSSKGWYERQAA
jgi:ACR3 family arsenite transporter